MGADLTRRLRQAVERTGAGRPFSGVVRVTTGGGATGCLPVGWANRAERIPNRAETLFQMASGSKTFTAVATLQSVDRGEVSLHESVRRFTERLFPRIDPRVTIHQLLTHTSGIPDYFDEAEAPDGEFERLWWERPCYRFDGPSELHRWIGDRPMRFCPGERFHYSNAGYILLGRILECVTDRPFREVVEETVLRRAGMERSGYIPADRLPPGTALAYIDSGDGAGRTNVFSVPSIGQPDGGAYTTAGEMDRFWRALRGGELLRPALVDEMFRAHVAAGTGGRAYGYGIWILPSPSGPRYTAVGCDPGVEFVSSVDPAGCGITVLGNSDVAGRDVYRSLVAGDPGVPGTDPAGASASGGLGRGDR